MSNNTIFQFLSSPAHCGAAKGQMETLKILSTHKANLWLRNAKGDMPLHEAVQSGRKGNAETHF